MYHFLDVIRALYLRCSRVVPNQNNEFPLKVGVPNYNVFIEASNRLEDFTKTRSEGPGLKQDRVAHTVVQLAPQRKHHPARFHIHVEKT